MQEIIIFKSAEDSIEVQVKFDGETVWLTQSQMGELFNQTKQNISLHINNCFKEGELDKSSVVKESLTTAADGKEYKTSHYDLNVIISVGYRVKSKQGTQFRIWANKILKDYLIQGYAIDKKRLAQRNEELQTLKKGISILGRALEEESDDTANPWLQHFAKGLELLDDYDHENLDEKGLTLSKAKYPTLQDYELLVEHMRSGFDSDVFGREKDKSFQSSIIQISKGFGENDFYTSIEEKAATLLYLITKNHSFVDGNKRIAAACFLKFLEVNNMLTYDNELPFLSNEAIVSLTLFIATSKPEEMDVVKRLVISVLNRSK